LNNEREEGGKKNYVKMQQIVTKYFSARALTGQRTIGGEHNQVFDLKQDLARMHFHG